MLPVVWLPDERAMVPLSRGRIVIGRGWNWLVDCWPAVTAALGSGTAFTPEGAAGTGTVGRPGRGAAVTVGGCTD